jgi:hypothetical protein
VVAVTVIMTVLFDWRLVVDCLITLVQKRCWVSLRHRLTSAGQFVAGEGNEFVGEELDALMLVIREMRVRPPLGGVLPDEWDVDPGATGRKST